MRRQLEKQGEPNLDDKLAEEFGYFEVASKEIKDYHQQWLDIPVGLFRNAQRTDSNWAELQQALKDRRPWFAFGSNATVAPNTSAW